MHQQSSDKMQLPSPGEQNELPLQQAAVCVNIEPEVIMLFLAGVITQITSPSELHNRISECQGSRSLPLSHWLWSGWY